MIIRTISTSDFNFIIELAASENVRYTKADLTSIMEYEPDGCFIALDGERRLGIVSTVVLGKIGWIGNVFVERSARRRGAGSKLVREALRYIQDKGGESPKLYCFPHRIAFYKRLGFSTETNIQVFGEIGRKTSFSNVKELNQDSLDELITLDESFFGANRSKILCRLLQEFEEYCFGTYIDGKLVGYIMASGSGDEYELGPWVCEPKYQDRLAEDLLRVAINKLDGKNFELSSPMHNTVCEAILQKFNFKSKGVAVRMGLGRSSLGRIEGVLGTAGLDKG